MRKPIWKMAEGQDIYDESRESPSTLWLVLVKKKWRALQSVSFSARSEDSADNFEEMAR